MGVIIIAVFWLLGLLMAWSMCVVAERADRRMEEIRHTHTDTDISRPADTGHAGRGRRPVRAMDGCHDDNAGDGGTMNEHYLLKTIGGGGCLFGLILIPFARRRTRRSR